MQRLCAVIALPSENRQQYEDLHKSVWPSVLQRLHDSNVRNYSIYRYRELLVSYMEYVGENLELDMAAIAEDPTTLEWWELTAPLQMSLRADTGDEWWTQIPEVFHMD